MAKPEVCSLCIPCSIYITGNVFKRRMEQYGCSGACRPGPWTALQTEIGKLLDNQQSPQATATAVKAAVEPLLEEAARLEGR